jgi:hypothetical protein
MDSGHLHIGGRKWRDVKRPRREDPGSDSGCCQPRHRPRRAPGTVADRIITFAEIVGCRNIIAGTDCGLSGRVHPQIAWAKLCPARRRSRVRNCGVEFKVPERDERNKRKKG